MRPSEERAVVVSAYVSDRLTTEKKAEGRGYIARVAKRTGFSPPHVSTVADGKSCGEDFGNALAKFWNFKNLDALTDAAREWAKTRELKVSTAPMAKAGNVELQKALDFLDGQIDAKVIRSWVDSHHDQGWAGVKRDEFVTMIRGHAMEIAAKESPSGEGPKPSGAAGLARGIAARKKKG